MRRNRSVEKMGGNCRRCPNRARTRRFARVGNTGFICHGETTGPIHDIPCRPLGGKKTKKSKSKIGLINWLLCDGHCTCKRRQGSTTRALLSSCLRLLRLDSCWREVRWWHLRTAVDVGGGVVRLVPATLAPQHATYYTKHYHRSCSAGLHRYRDLHRGGAARVSFFVGCVWRWCSVL